MQEAGQMPVLEHPDHRTEGRRQREDVQDQRLDRHEDAAERGEQKDERRDRDDPDGEGELAEQRTLRIDELRWRTADLDRERLVRVADLVDDMLRLLGKWIDG